MASFPSNKAHDHQALTTGITRNNVKINCSKGVDKKEVIKFVTEKCCFFIVFQAPQLKYERVSVKLSVFDDKDIPVKGDTVLYKRYSKTQIY